MHEFAYSVEYLKGPDPSLIYRASSWTTVRYIGDGAHAIALSTLIILIVLRQSIPAGLSFKSRALYLSLFVIRYIDIFDGRQNLYLVFFKSFYIGASAFIVAMFLITLPRYQLKNDPLSALVLCVCSFLATVILSYEMTLSAYLWTLSQCIESCVMLPQYVAIYSRKGRKSPGTTIYIVFMAAYRVCAALSWFWKKYNYGSNYQDFPFFIFDLPVTVDFFCNQLIESYRSPIVPLLLTKEVSGEDDAAVMGRSNSWAKVGTSRRRKIDEERELDGLI